MRYKLNKKSNNNYNSENIMYDILEIRGIENPVEYLNLTDKSEIHYSKLNNIDKAVQCFLKHIENNDNIHIQPDNDVDGITSGAVLYNYIHEQFPNVAIFWDMQEGKKHGVDLKKIDESVKLVIIPDAGSNQFNEHKQLREKGIDCIVLDHHNVDYESKDAIIVNNQLSEEYDNKNLSGVGIVYKFLQALDDELWIDKAKEYLDLVALGNVADMMDIKSLETRYYINKGLKRIRNKMFRTLLDKQEFSTKGKINPMTVAFYVAPLINALIRFGTEEDKKLLFEAFIDVNKTFLYTPRKSKNNENPQEIEENIYEHMTRVCISAKGKQDRYKTKVGEQLKIEIIEKSLDKNQILLLDVSDTVVKNATGLIATQLANDFLKPCILLRKNKDVYQGSMRGVDSGELDDFKGFLENLNLCDWVQGHNNASGIQINGNNINTLINKSNEILKNVDFQVIYVDYIIPFNELTDDLIEGLSRMDDIWGQGLKEALIKVENIKVPCKSISLLGDKKNNISFDVEDITFIKFKCDEIEYNKIIEDEDGWGSIKESVTFDVIGRCNINEYNGQRKLQIIVEDWNYS